MYALAIAAMLALSPIHGRTMPVDDAVIYTFDTIDEQNEWFTTGLASIDDLSGYISPAFALRLTGAATLPQSGVARKFLGPELVVTVGQTYIVRAWLKADSAVDPLTFRISDGTSPTDSWSVSKAQIGSGWQLYEFGTFVNSIDPSLAVMQIFVPPPSSGTWAIDDIEIVSVEEEDMTKRREIREALVTRIGTVTTGNGYTLSVGSVVTGPARIETGEAYPLVAVRHGEEVKTIHTLGRKQSVITFYVGVACRRTDTTDPDDQADDACGEIEKAVETMASSMHLGLSYITNVFVAGIDPEELTPEVARDMAAWTMTVEVTYTHTRLQP